MAIEYSKKRNEPDPAPSGGAGGGVSLSKVTLTKAAPKVSLTKSGGAGGTVKVHLAWDARPAQAPSGGGGFLAKLKQAATGASGGIDLDLGALYEFTDGSKGVVQALGNAFRDRGPGEPLVWLDGDDRTGGGGENLYVDLRDPARLKRVLVFAFIYEGVPNWAAADGVVTLKPASGPEIEVRLDEHDDRSPMCAIAQIVSDGREVSVQREVRYVQGGQQALDEAYGWGMRWQTGRK
ncbi:Tellurium resistance [Paenibacillus sp. TRM 82003]|uniref:TerD family protein n=1 Tax=Kineococcus sp. TRM81007 TaxID=2925831 RepID=UPI001F5A44CD|nr:tellurium resistance protein [Kineococcus sp. TRM81007]MCI2239557.1 tellurium resistance protein [Kineococcus sp. TRM81007]MCI3926161.1 Tellurium resistance [Paenibacillus sp. TRM 82003]